MSAADAVDFALAAFREEGVWQLAELTPDHATDVETLVGALRRFPGDGGAVGLVAVEEDFFVVVRVAGQQTRVMLSDITAASEWELAAEVVEHLGLPAVEDEDDPEPAGDLELLSDLGVDAMFLAEVLDDDELYPDEMLSEIARGMGFGELFDDVVGLTSA
ncbi:tRNA adenosine deaminase-associated protein [Nocardioides sp. LML1-1-1.1]|uniref:tRNA adenosine deaminase-associated protein n=1 Tax=Nocardioides sp. LML1-1-1.1 TaxID=3135248 RepID=UPI00341E1180